MTRNFKTHLHILAFALTALMLAPGTVLADEADAAKPVDGQFMVKIGSVLSIEVFREKDLSGEYRVGETGMIIFPLIGEVKAADMSIEEFRKSLAEAMKKYIKDPLISVSLVKDKSDVGYDVVLVLGQVKTQGAQPMTPAGSSLLKAIAQAGGFTPIANPRAVKVVSNRDGERKTTVYNLHDIFEARSDDPKIYSKNVVYVGESTF